ncbi:MAG: 2-oxoacid:ferredoxin oxidoreductase subunit gamma [Nitrospirae bacterium]|nr:2-oxoacid:ferredoxin oxidoreductase subunit gamma [Nitrospirota bacterium]
METSVIVAGSGGQGVLLLGRLIAYTGMLAGRHVTWFPSYGAEMRGGTANCTVVISDTTVGSPIVEQPDSLIIMNCPSLKRFITRLKDKGTLIYDSSLINDSTCPDGDLANIGRYNLIAIPASNEASALGSIRYANMVLFGAFLGHSGLAGIKTAEEALYEMLSQRHHHLIEENLKAIKRGLEMVMKKRQTQS